MVKKIEFTPQAGQIKINVSFNAKMCYYYMRMDKNKN